ncbi:unnamed protein product, partial [marine sediment metagenome]
MCGTPVTQGSPDIFSPSLAADKGEKFGFSYDKFVQKRFFNNGYRLVAKRGSLEEISDKIFLNALRFTKKECLDLPEKLYTSIPIELIGENAK